MTALPITAPYHPRAATEVAGAIRHVWEVVAEVDGGLDAGGYEVPLEVVSGSVTFDEAWAPHVQASLVLRYDTATAGHLDPRTGARIKIRAGYGYPDGDFFGFTDTWTLARLGVTRRAVSRPGNDLRLSAMSDEVLAQDMLWHADMSPSLSDGWEVFNALSAISYLVWLATGRAPHFEPGLDDIGRRLDDQAWPDADWLPEHPGAGTTSVWSLIESVADIYDLWVIDRGGFNTDTGTDVGWEVRRRPTGLGAARAQLKTGPAGNLVETDSEISAEDGWANVVHLIHTWDDANGNRHRLTTRSYVASGPMSVQNAGYRAIAVERTAPINQVDIRAACGALVRRTVTRGRSYRLVAPAMYWLRPGHPVTVQLPTGDQERHIVQRVTFTHPDGLMDVTTRLPETVEIQGAD